MNRSKLLFFLLIIFLMGMQSSAEENIPIQIFYSGNMLGYIESCGCGGDKRGGIVRWATFIKKNIQDAPINLILDSGYFVSIQSNVKNLKTEYMAKSMSEMKYDAINLSEKDISAIDKNILLNLGKKYRLPFVSANIFHLKSMELLTRPYIIKSFRQRNKEIKIGILGLSQQTIMEKQGLIIKEPISIAKEIVDELKDKCALIIAITQLTKEESVALAKEVTGINIIICDRFARSQDRLTNKVGNTLLLQASSKANDATAIKLYINEKGEIISFEEKFAVLEENIPYDAEIDKINKEYKKKAKENESYEFLAPVSRNTYAGTKKCSQCHPQQYKHWQKTKHAKAFYSLKKVKEEKNPECLKCHTTRFKQDNGFLDYKTTPNFANVGCEECHRLGIGHVLMAGTPLTSKEINSKPNKIDSDTICLKCHTNDKDPKFNFEEYKKKIIH